MKTKETKKTIKKAVKAKQTETVRKAVPKKVAKATDAKTLKTKKSASIKTAATTKKIVQKPVITKPVAKKKTVTVKAEVKVKAKPKAKASKVSAIKPKPAIKAKKKAMPVKAEVKVKAKPKAKASKVSAIKSKPAIKAKKKAMPVKAEVKVKAKPKAKASKVSAIKPKPAIKPGEKAVAAKKEPAVRVRPSLKSVVATKKYETSEEPKPKAELYPIKSSGARLKIFLPEQDLTKQEAEEIFFGGLPEEYGENSVIALVVDPNTIFVDWEVVPKDISDKEGDLNLRFYDITGIEFNDWNAHSVIDVPINKRVGNGFFDIHMPGCDVVVAVGILNAVNGFMPLVRSDMVSFPDLLTFDELGIVQKLFESGIPVGY